MGLGLITLYTESVGLLIYWFSCHEPAPGTHEAFTAPLWKQAVGYTTHCAAGDTTGIIIAIITTVFLPAHGRGYLYSSRIALRIEDMKFEPHPEREFRAKLVESVKKIQDGSFELAFGTGEGGVDNFLLQKFP